ncbi:MAG: ribonuclease III [Clostridiales bacterium]|nr:ribonuclease III [Clostridiales bacterium]
MENTAISHNKTDEISPLTLAFVGDGVYDLLVREFLVNRANRPVGELNRQKVKLVNCKSQAEFAKSILPKLSEKEASVYKRGRNAAPKCTPKNASVADYHSATGLESLFGYLYLNGEDERVKELFDAIIHIVFNLDGDKDE